MILSIVLLVVALVVYAIIMVGLISIMVQSLYAPPFAPTFNPQVVKVIKQKLEENPELDLIFEPGCGVANIALAIKKNFPEKEVWGVEVNWFVYAWAVWINWMRLPKNQIKLAKQDYFKFDQQKIQNGRPALVYSYLLPEFVTKLHEEGKFKNCLIVSLDFQIQTLQPTEVIQMNGSKIQYKIYIYDLRNK
ncbi:MAG: hypothetical protein OHK0017_02980 [Patescibacteria group bacterium]